jgi:hypothetical protein
VTSHPAVSRRRAHRGRRSRDPHPVERRGPPSRKSRGRVRRRAAGRRLSRDRRGISTVDSSNRASLAPFAQSVVSSSSSRSPVKAGTLPVVCGAKRAIHFSSRLQERILADVPHAQWVFSLPKMLRVYFLFHRELLGEPHLPRLRGRPLDLPQVRFLDEATGLHHRARPHPKNARPSRYQRARGCRFRHGGDGPALGHGHIFRVRAVA